MKLSTRLVTLLLLAFAGCTNPKSEVVTEPTKDQVIAKVVQSKALTAEEKQLFASFMVRATASTALGGLFATQVPKASYNGKTVAQIIEEERAFAAQQKADEDKRARLAAEAKANADALAAEINKALTVAVFDKRAVELGFSGTYLKLAAENTSGKDIRGFTGRLKIRDMFGDELDETAVKVTDPMSAGSKHTWEELVTDSRVRKASLKDLKFEWTPEQVLFADGSQLGPLKAPE